MLEPDGGGGGPTWNGSITVLPGALSGASPSFSAASNQVTESMASVMPWNDPGGTGITDGAAGGAWSRLVTVWTKDLTTLSNGLGDLSYKLIAASGSYVSTDGAAFHTYK